MAAYIAVIGPGQGASEDEILAAEEVGSLLGRGQHTVVTGGLGGVMAAACRGASSVGGTTVGLLPGDDRSQANPDLTVALATGLGEMRNALVVRVSDAIIAIGGSWGTLSEVALAVRTGVPVVALHGWSVDPDGHPAAGGPQVADSPGAAVTAAVTLADQRPRGG